MLLCRVCGRRYSPFPRSIKPEVLIRLVGGLHTVTRGWKGRGEDVDIELARG